MFKKIIIKAISGYQKYKKNTRDTSPCRFTPTCSQYSKEAIDKYGILKGMLLGVVRVLKCNPLFRGGSDPVK